MPIETFLLTHFKFGGESPNPRLVLLFLSFTFEESIRYYARNPDKASIFANEMDEYEVVLNEHIMRGYRRLQETVGRQSHTYTHRTKNMSSRLSAKMGSPKTCSKLTLASVKTLTGWDLSDDEFQSFVAFFTHIGLFVPEDATLPFDKRMFSFLL